MFRFCFRSVLLIAGVLSADELPDLSGLGQPRYADRELARVDLTTWILQNQKTARQKLLTEYLQTNDPEIRVRMLSLLERAYFPPVGYVGIYMQSARRGLNGGFQPGNQQAGVKIIMVAPGTPAEASGLQENDILVEIGDWKVGNGFDVVTQVTSRIQSNPPGALISLGVKRGEEFLRLKFKLGVLPVPSDRARSVLAADDTGRRLLPVTLQKQIKEFRSWLEEEIRKDRKNLIAD